MAKKEEFGFGSLLLKMAIYAGAMFVGYILDRRRAQEENEQPPSLTHYLAGGALIGALDGAFDIINERKLRKWHKKYPQLSRTLKEIERNPRVKKALDKYVRLTRN